MLLISAEHFTNNEEVAIYSKMSKDEKSSAWSCLECGFRKMNKTDVFRHVESCHVATAGHFCPFCSKVLRSMNAFNAHRRRCLHKITFKNQY